MLLNYFRIVWSVSFPNEYVYSWQARHNNIMNTLASFVREFSNNAVTVRMIQESASTSLRLAVTHAFFLGHYPGRMSPHTITSRPKL